MGWNDVRKGGAGNFLQIEVGKPVKIHILLKEGEEPVSYHTHFIQEANGGKGQSVVCPGSKTCPCCANKKAYKLRTRHAVNVYDMTSGEVKVLEGGNSIFKQLKAAFEEYGNLDEIDFKITKSGSGLDTEYTILPIASKFQEDIESLELQDLNEIASPTDPEDIQNLMQGGTLGSDDDSNEDAAPAPAAKAKKKPAPAEDDDTPPADDNEDAAPAPAAKAKKKPAPAEDDANEDAAPDHNRKKLIEQVNMNFVTLNRYVNPALIRTDMVTATKSKTNLKGKTTLDQFTPQELQKLLDIQSQHE